MIPLSNLGTLGTLGTLGSLGTLGTLHRIKRQECQIYHCKSASGTLELCLLFQCNKWKDAKDARISSRARETYTS
jgi:hypothetical protein